MRINSDFGLPVGVKTGTLDWQASPMPGVDRRMLDRIGGEVARATSIVRYAPGSHFSAHTHDGGEEFIVLEGTFQDEHGDYPVGTYVRNPVGTRHIPRSDNGCTIFVKLWQFDPADRRQCAIDLNQVVLDPEGQDGSISRAILHQVAGETVQLEQLAPGTTRKLDDAGGAELLVLDGTVEWAGRTFGRHDWIRLPAGHPGTLRTGADGARLWIKIGHLAAVTIPVA